MEGIIIYRYCITRKRPFKQKKKQRKLKMNKKNDINVNLSVNPISIIITMITKI